PMKSSASSTKPSARSARNAAPKGRLTKPDARGPRYQHHRVRPDRPGRQARRDHRRLAGRKIYAPDLRGACRRAAGHAAKAAWGRTRQTTQGRPPGQPGQEARRGYRSSAPRATISRSHRRFSAGFVRRRQGRLSGDWRQERTARSRPSQENADRFRARIRGVVRLNPGGFAWALKSSSPPPPDFSQPRFSRRHQRPRSAFWNLSRPSERLLPYDTYAAR